MSKDVSTLLLQALESILLIRVLTYIFAVVSAEKNQQQ
jgi:hypothetical protein